MQQISPGRMWSGAKPGCDWAREIVPAERLERALGRRLEQARSAISSGVESTRRPACALFIPASAGASQNVDGLLSGQASTAGGGLRGRRSEVRRLASVHWKTKEVLRSLPVQASGKALCTPQMIGSDGVELLIPELVSLSPGQLRLSPPSGQQIGQPSRFLVTQQVGFRYLLEAEIASRPCRPKQLWRSIHQSQTFLGFSPGNPLDPGRDTGFTLRSSRWTRSISRVYGLPAL